MDEKYRDAHSEKAALDEYVSFVAFLWRRHSWLTIVNNYSTLPSSRHQSRNPDSSLPRLALQTRLHILHLPWLQLYRLSQPMA